MSLRVLQQMCIRDSTNTLYGYVTGEGIGRYSEPGRNFRVTLAYTF